MIMEYKKPHPKFNVPNFGAKSRSRVKARWRKQRGIDSKKRIKKSFMGAEPTIGYRNPESLRGVRENGMRILLVHNTKQIEAALAEGKTFDVTIGKSVSARKRVAITGFAKSKGLDVTNGAY